MSIPLEARLDIIDVLRSTPIPWRSACADLEIKHGLSHQQVMALAWSLMRCGFDDPYISGARPLDELRGRLLAGAGPAQTPPEQNRG